ncbi:MAG: hypothetical protein ACXAEU_12750 [Candidatus Hodarchaeales archaeon]|jgi:hypothetical protein
MSENDIVEYLRKTLQYKKTIAFVLPLLGIFIIDLTIGPLLAFWMVPLVLGVISGILVVSARVGVFSALGTMMGRLLSIIFMVLTVPGFLATLDLFINAIGDFIGISLPAGALIVILLSVLFCGIFTALGGMTGGSLARIVQIFMAQKKETDEPRTSPE